MKLRQYQQDSVDNLMDTIQVKGNPILQLPTGCHQKGTLVLTTQGKFVPVENIKVGDQLVGDDGKPRTVLRLCRGQDKMYKIKPTRGTPFVVNGKHILSLIGNETGRKDCDKVVDISVENFLTMHKTYKAHHILFRLKEPVFFEEKPVLLPPHFLGVLLGDACLKYKKIMLSTAEPELIQEANEIGKMFNVEIRCFPYKSENCYDINFKYWGKQGNPIKKEIKRLGLYAAHSNEKFVPDEYKFNSVKVRLGVLAGLLDTDGYYNKGCYEYTTVSDKLADDFCFLAGSVGGLRCTKREKWINGKKYHRIHLSGDTEKIPCIVARRQSKDKHPNKDTTRTGFTVEYIGVDNYYGFILDGNHRYVMQDWFITHNSGKSIIIAEIARRMRERWGGIQILVLAHRAKLVEQDADKFAKLGLIPSVYCAELKRKEIGQFTIATILSVAKHPELFKGVHLVIVDECFTGDTLVATPDGQKRIDKLKENDYIISAIGNNKIKKIKKTVHKTVYKIRVRYEDNNRQGQRVYTVRCSGRHPFFTTQGWVRAEQMVRGMELVGIQNMPELWQAVSSGKGAWDNIVRKKKILLREVLLSESESYEKRADKKESVKQAQKYWMEAARSLWKRISEPDTGEMVKCVKKGRMGCRTTNKDRAQSNRWERLSDKLQSGFGKRTIKIGNRIRWIFSQFFGKKGIRQKKGYFSSKYWVESVEVEEQRRGVALYDLQIEGHPSFFANGLLVHNCQLINNNDEGSYRKFLSQLPLAKVVGLSATPFRLKGGACYGEDRLFARIAYKIGFSDLVKQGYLTPPVNYDANSEDTYDDIKLTAGDFNQKDMNAHFNKIVGKSCQDLVNRMRNRNYVLVFACSIVHAEAIVKRLQELGEQAEVYHSEMSLMEDKMTIQRFENKQFKYLVSIDKLGVGFDAPFVDGLALMRPTMSRALAIQQLGRGSRLYEGKKDFLVADYAGNIRRHNLLDPDAYDVPYEKIVKPKRSGGDAPSKVCPKCQAICATRTTQCGCGYKFPPKLAVKADTKTPTAEKRLPIKIWHATIEESMYGKYVKLLVGNFGEARPVFFFPESRGRYKVETMLRWTTLFPYVAMPIRCDMMCERLNELAGDYSEAVFEKKGKFFELKKLIKEKENVGCDKMS